MTPSRNFNFDPEAVKTEFRDWLSSLPFPPHDVNGLNLDDGEKHRFRILGDKASEKNGEFRLHLHGFPNGWGRSYKASNEYLKWKYQQPEHTNFTTEERKKFAEECKTKDEERRREDEKERVRGIANANRLWETATPANAHDIGTYLFKKNLSSAHGAKQLGKNILVPVYNEQNELVNVQTIDPDGTKKFQYAAPKRGCFYIIEGTGEHVFVGEGFATCGTIHEATGATVVVAFDCGNLSPVIENVLPRFIGKLVIAADNDRKTTGNPGIAAAVKVSETFGIPYIYPQFKENGVGSDFNDFRVIHGVEATQKAIFEQLNGETGNPHATKFLEHPHWLDVHQKSGLPLCTVENLKSLLSFYNIHVWFDLCKREKKYALPSSLDNGSRFGVENRLNSILSLVRSLAEGQSYPVKFLEDYLSIIADENRRHPVREWINSCEWDKKDRLKDLFETIRVADWFPNDFKGTILRRWIISAVAAAFSDEDFRSRGVLVLQGKQRLGKTSWLKSLVPQRSDWLLEGALLDPEDKDSVKRALSFWIVELGEIEGTLGRSDLNKLKAFITSSFDSLRLPWAREVSQFARRTVYAGSVNRADFLIDETGNSRFWVLPCVEIDYSHGIDVLQLWRQIYEECYLKGEQHWLSPSEDNLLDQMNENFESADEVEEAILSAFDFSDYENDYGKHGIGWMNTTQTLIRSGIQNPTKSQVRRGAAILKKLTRRESTRVSVGHNRGRCFWLPNKNTI